MQVSPTQMRTYIFLGSEDLSAIFSTVSFWSTYSNWMVSSENRFHLFPAKQKLSPKGKHFLYTNECLLIIQVIPDRQGKFSRGAVCTIQIYPTFSLTLAV